MFLREGIKGLREMVGGLIWEVWDLDREDGNGRVTISCSGFLGGGMLVR